nr:hypothetical protein [Clostridiales bacterium]
MKKVISLLLCAALLFAVAPAVFAAEEEPFVPALRFIASSDSHIKGGDDNRNYDRVRAMLSQAYALADADGAYNS